MRTRRPLATLAATAALVLSGCTLDPTSVPLPGGADVGDEPFEVTVEFRDVLDLVPQSAVRVDDIAVGRVIDIKLKGWTAQVTVLVNGDVELPDNAEATIRQSSLLGEKFVSLDAPASGAATGELSDGDSIPLERSGRNPEVEEVLGAASLLFNGGGLEKTNIIVTELNKAVTGNETEIKQLLQSSTQFLGQIDTNKDALLGALEKVDNLAVTANAQEAALTSALDNLPEALTVLDQQRDDLVRLTTALQELGDTATGVIAASREDTIANLQALQPILANLALAGDDLVANLSTIATFPFPDEAVGGSLTAAQTSLAECPVFRPGSGLDYSEVAYSDIDSSPKGCSGDSLNLKININLAPEELQFLLAGLLGLDLGTALPSAAEAPVPDAEGTEGAAGSGQLVDLIEGLTGDVGGGGEVPGAPAAPGTSPSPAPSPTPGASGAGGGGLLCGLLGSCRAPAASASSSDLAGLLLPTEVLS